MAAPNETRVSSMKPLETGGVLVAPFGSTLPPETVPSGGSVAIDPAFIALGYMDQDTNVTNAEEVNSSEGYAWGGDIVINVTTTRKETYQFKAIEQGMESWKLRYGDSNATGTDANALIVHDGASFEGYHSVIVAEKLKDGRIHLTVIPKAKLESAGDVEHSDTDAYGYDMTFTAMPYSGSKTSFELYYTPSE